MPTPRPLTPDELLTTTRAVRRRLDFERPVPQELVSECVEIALQAPSGSNARGWHFVLVGDEARRHAVAECYRKAYANYPDMPVSAHALAKQAQGDDVGVMNAVVSSADALAENLHRAPWLVIPCLAGRLPPIEGPMGHLAQASQFGSILPAFWSFMLAARDRGLGTAWTTLHLMFEEEAAALLGIPHAQITQCALSPLAYTLGTDFKPARRKPLDGVMHTDAW